MGYSKLRRKVTPEEKEVFKRTHKWKILGDKAYLDANHHCSECNEEECLKDTFGMQNPNKNYADYEIFVNNKLNAPLKEPQKVEEATEPEEIEEPVE